MPFKGYFVDDTEEEKIFAQLLSTKADEGLVIEYRKVSEAATLAAEMFDTKPDIVALDFRLDENPNMIAPKNSYNGSGLAQLLRDKCSEFPERDFPIVLISSEEKYERYYRPDGTAHDLFDRVYGKVPTGENPDPVQTELLTLCNGYKTLKEVWRDGQDRLSILGLDSDEQEIISSQELRAAITSAGAPHIAARFILRGVIDRPGLLLSDEEIAARLGVSEIGPLADELIKQDILYGGIFHHAWRRWWAHRFEDWARAFFAQRPTNMAGSERVKILQEKLNVKLSPAISTWNKSSDEKFAFACASCLRPGEIRHSVTVFDPHAPRFCHKRRICWDCIQTEKYKNLKLEVDDVDQNLVIDVATKGRE